MSQTVDRALSILPLLAQGPADLGQVAERLGVHKSTALRLLRTLHEHGLVHRQQDQRYRLGARLFALAQEAVENLDIREIAHPYLTALNERIGHTIHLAVYEEGEVVYIDKVESRYPVRMYSRIGKPVAITVAAVAKLLLADLPEPERRAVAAKLDYPRTRPVRRRTRPPSSRSWRPYANRAGPPTSVATRSPSTASAPPSAEPTGASSPPCRSRRPTWSSRPRNSSRSSRRCAAPRTTSAGSTPAPPRPSPRKPNDREDRAHPRHPHRPAA